MSEKSLAATIKDLCFFEELSTINELCSEEAGTIIGGVSPGNGLYTSDSAGGQGLSSSNWDTAEKGREPPPAFRTAGYGTETAGLKSPQK